MKILLSILIFVLLFSACSRNKVNQSSKVDHHIYLSGSLKAGESLAEALIKQDIDNPQVYLLVNKLNEIYNLRKAHPADSFLIKIDTLGVVKELSYIPNNQYTYKVLKDTLDDYYTLIDTLKMKKIIKFCQGEIEYSLYQSMIDQGEGSALPVMFTQIFQWDIDFFIDPQKGDKFRLIYEQYMANDSFVRYGNILVAQYISRNFDKIAYRYTNEKGITRYYNEKGTCFQKAFLKSPLNYRRISSYFGYRTHPITKKVRFHNGVDYAAAYGTPVESVGDGVVIHRGWKGGHPTVNGRSGGYGKTVIIRHSNSYKTLYGHLSSYNSFKVGDRVKQHDVIGYVGSTGLSTGNHLHYTIYHHDQAINPMKLKNVSGPPVPKFEIPIFKAHIDSLYQILSADSILSVSPGDESSLHIEEFDAVKDVNKGYKNRFNFNTILLILLSVLIIALIIRIVSIFRSNRIRY